MPSAISRLRALVHCVLLARSSLPWLFRSSLPWLFSQVDVVASLGTHHGRRPFESKMVEYAAITSSEFNQAKSLRRGLVGGFSEENIPRRRIHRERLNADSPTTLVHRSDDDDDEAVILKMSG